MRELQDEAVAVRINRFVREIYVRNVQADSDAVHCAVQVDDPAWLLNDHFPGTSIIQCAFQGAMLLYCENQPEFDPLKSMFFLGGLRVKFAKPIFLGHRVGFAVSKAAFRDGVLLFEVKCADAAGKAYARISGSLATKSRAAVSALAQA